MRIGQTIKYRGTDDPYHHDADRFPDLGLVINIANKYGALRVHVYWCRTKTKEWIAKDAILTSKYHDCP